MYRGFYAQQSAAELFAQLIQLFLEEFKDELLHLQQCSATCLKCNRHAQVGRDEDQQKYVLILNGEADYYRTFEDYAGSFTALHPLLGNPGATMEIFGMFT